MGDGGEGGGRARGGERARAGAGGHGPKAGNYLGSYKFGMERFGKKLRKITQKGSAKIC